MKVIRKKISGKPLESQPPAVDFRNADALSDAISSSAPMPEHVSSSGMITLSDLPDFHPAIPLLAMEMETLALGVQNPLSSDVDSQSLLSDFDNVTLTDAQELLAVKSQGPPGGIKKWHGLRYTDSFMSFLTTPPTPVYSGLQITYVTVELTTNSGKWIQSFDIKVDAVAVSGHLRERGTPGICKTMTVVLERPSHWKDIIFSVDARELSAVKSQGAPGGIRKWHGTFGKVNLTVGFTTRATHPMERTFSEASTSITNVSMERTISETATSIANVSLDNDYRAPRPRTTESILRDCPQFRASRRSAFEKAPEDLIADRSWQISFDQSDLVAHTNLGDANINKEIFAKENPYFILHDSKGFEQGDDTNVKIVIQFISERNNMPLIKDKLHAVWLCLDIPTAGGRLLETGIEEFLKVKIERKLGNVPVIAVFTKFDLLVLRENRLLKTIDREGKTPEEISQLIQKNARDKLQEICIEPFEKFVEWKVPHVTVSTEEGYGARLENLIQTTYECVRDSFEDASVFSAYGPRTI
ncbi:hypothetical protein H0H92_006177 [Tricholoma furcatifolium]|nr:hypothetical protein H0H92_006177 [Tricholoma furcatifolium]